MGETGETHLFVKSSIYLKASLKNVLHFQYFPVAPPRHASFWFW